jgi:hypothetical protein
MTRLLLAVILLAPSLDAADLHVGESRIVAQGPAIVNPRAAFGAGNYLVIWQEGYPTAGAGGIRAVRLKASSLEPLDAQPIMVCPQGAAPESPAVAYADGAFLIAWQDFRNGTDYEIHAALLDATTGRGKGMDISVRSAPGNQVKPAVASDGKTFLVVWQEPAGSSGYGVRGIRISSAGRLLDSEPIICAQTGTSPAAAGFGGRFLVTWSILDGRAATAAALVDAGTGNLMKPLGTINTVCAEGTSAAAGESGDFAVVSARGSYPNPWGWPGPGAVLASRVFRDGSTPESRLDYGPRLSNLCARTVPNVIDAATWGKTSQSWDAGAVGGFPGTADGLWPHGRPAVARAWDGVCLFAWVKGAITSDRLTLTDLSVWLRGVDARTLSPRVAERRITGHAAMEETSPILVSGPAGEVLLTTLGLTRGEGREVRARCISRKSMSGAGSKK